MANKDYYQILGVEKGASQDEIKKAFRKMAHKFHPDKEGGNEAMFKEASEAYSILSDDKKRAEYDSYGRVFNGGAGPAGGQGGFNPNDFGFDFSGFANGQQDFDLGDIFGDIFGGASQPRTKRGRDISMDIELTFKESVFGSERKILLTKAAQCERCKGNGAEPGTEKVTCTTCNGKGRIREMKRSFFGTFATETTCDTCYGSGKMPKVKCKECNGVGVTRKQHEVKIMIPAGINDGEMIRLSGAGEAVPGGITGDLYVKIHVKKDAIFTKDVNDLRMDLKVKLSDALLGGEYAVALLDGNDIKVKIPAGVTYGEILKIKGKGIPYEKSKRGDLLIRVNVVLPTKLSNEAKKLIEALKKEGI